MKKITLDDIREMLPGARSYSGYVSGLCPFHDDSHPSLIAYEDGFFRCLGCGVFGGLEKLHRKLKGWDASRAVAVEESFSSPPLPTDLREQEELVENAHISLTKFDQFRWYLEQRGVAGRIDQCRLGWYKGWYTIPIYNSKLDYLGVVLRAGSEIQKVSGMRFIQPRGQRPMMYCPDWNLARSAPALAVVYGLFDALALSDLRFPVVTPTGGKDNMNPEWLEEFRKPIYIIPDKGEEGTATRLAGSLGWRGHVLLIDYPDNIKDPAGFLEVGLSNLLVSAVGGALS